MINPRVQIREKLLEVCDNVKVIYPTGKVDLPMIVYSEIVNIELRKWQVELEYQVDVFANSFSDVLELASLADSKMKELGFNRSYISSDADVCIGTDLYKKVMSFEATVNTNEMNIFTEV